MIQERKVFPCYFGSALKLQGIEAFGEGLSDFSQYPEYLEATEHQRIICRCEQITEGAILEAIQRGAGTIDGVKRRTGSGMGLCQGSYCSARIAGLLADRVSALDGQVMKDGRDSYYLYQTGEQDQV